MFLKEVYVCAMILFTQSQCRTLHIKSGQINDRLIAGFTTKNDGVSESIICIHLNRGLHVIRSTETQLLKIDRYLARHISFSFKEWISA